MRRQRGSVFVYSLVVMIALVGVLAAIASTERLDVKAATNRISRLKAQMACRSAVQRFIATFANDLAGGGATTTGSSTTSTSTIAQTTGATTLQDDWAQLGTNGSSSAGDELVTVGDTTFRMQVVDACSFVNMSKLTSQTWLNNLPLSQEEIDAYTDYTTPGENPLPDGGKDQYYNGLTNPYNAKLATLDTLDELLQIRYFKSQAIWEPNTNIVSTVTFTAGTNGQQPTLYDLLTPYSYAPNLRPGPLGQQQPRINIAIRGANLQRQLQQLGLSQATLTQIVNGPPITTMGTLLRQVANPNDRRTLLNNCSLSAGTRVSGLINLNTASQNVLSTIPNLTPDVVQSLITQQSTGFTQMSDCLNVAGYSGNALYSTIDYFCVQSSTFIVRVIGYSGDTAVAMEATVDIINNVPQLTRMAEVPFTDVIGRWNWNSQTSTETVLKEAS